VKTLIALFLFMLASQSCAMSADSRITLHFPARSVGTLVACQNVDSLFRGKVLGNAAGDIVTAKDTPLGLKLNYDGSENMAFLDKLKAPNLMALDMCKMGVEDSQFSHIASLPSLRRLNAIETELGDAGMLSIGKLTALRHLDISRTAVTSKGFREINHLTNLEDLYAASLKLDDDCISSLEHLTTIKSLGLSGSCVSDKAMVYLAKLKNLQELFISRSPVTDKGLAPVLANCKEIGHLDVANTDVTVKLLPALKGLPKLRSLTVTTRRFTPAQLNLMRKTLPQCLIKDENPSWAPVGIFEPLH
jgi:Leucine-rich repeat (LRR) protein